METIDYLVEFVRHMGRFDAQLAGWFVTCAVIGVVLFAMLAVATLVVLVGAVRDLSTPRIKTASGRPLPWER